MISVSENVPYGQPLAWFTRFTPPTATTVFTWTTDFSFVWGQTGPLPGVTSFVEIPVTSQRRAFTVTLNGDNTYTVKAN